MAYSTRRKSVNLSLLGIHVPRPSQPQKSPHSFTHHAQSLSSDESSAPPTKKIKRSHSEPSAPDSLQYLSSAPVFAIPASKDVQSSFASHTPPPSPPLPAADKSGSADPIAPPEQPESEPQYRKVDTDGINDDVVIATIEVLEKTGNRPHLLKELAAAIAGHVHVVETSANQSAIISSRLTNFLKRPWTALAPCPMGKELVGTHPKRLYFFLVTRPRQAIPDPDAPQNKRLSAAQSRIVTPSLTSGTSEDEDKPLRRRRTEPSVSPELELVSPDILDADDHLSRSTSFSISEGGSTSAYSHNNQTSPPLEKDEHEFTRTASKLQKKAEVKAAKLSDSALMFNGPLPEPSISFYEFEDNSLQRSQEFPSMIFGQTDGALTVQKPGDLLSSPMLYPHAAVDISRQSVTPLTLSIENPKMDTGFVWTELLDHPEAVELDELDDLFASY